MENLFKHIIYTYCDVEDPEGPDDLRKELENPVLAEKWGNQFTQELKYAIDHPGAITASQLKKLTGFDLNTEAEAQHWLRWLWSILFTDKPLNSAYLYLEDE